MDKFDLKKYISEGILNEDETSFSPEQIKILDSKIQQNLRGEVYPKLDDIYNTDEKKDELFNQTLDKFSSVVADYSQMTPSTSLEKKLFEIKLGKGSRAENIGPGELFVVIATKDTRFGTVGDVNSNGEEIEIKKSTSRELNLTYTAGGIFKFFPSLQALNSLIDNLKDVLQDYLPQYKTLSPNSQLLYKFLAKGFNELKIDPKLNFDGQKLVDSFKEFKPLFSLKRNDFIENDVDENFINELITDIERKLNKLSPELFKNSFKEALSTYFNKGFNYILFYKGKEGNYTPNLLPIKDVGESVDIESSTIRNGYQIYIKLKKDVIKEEESYSPGEKIERGYGLTSKFMNFIYSGLNKILLNLK